MNGLVAQSRHNFPFISDLEKIWLGEDSLLSALVPFKEQTYPRYNIVKMEDQGYRIEVAVPGMDAEDLTLTMERGWLRLIGSSVSTVDEESETYVHKGLTSKAFEKSWKLGESLKLERAYLEQGMLYIEMFFEKDKELTSTKIPIQEY